MNFFQVFCYSNNILLRARPEEATNIDSREAIDESDRRGSFPANVLL